MTAVRSDSPILKAVSSSRHIMSLHAEHVAFSEEINPNKAAGHSPKTQSEVRGWWLQENC